MAQLLARFGEAWLLVDEVGITGVTSDSVQLQELAAARPLARTDGPDLGHDCIRERPMVLLTKSCVGSEDHGIQA